MNGGNVSGAATEEIDKRPFGEIFLPVSGNQSTAEAVGLELQRLL